MNIDTFVTDPLELNLDQQQVGPLLAILSIGVGIGSVLAGVWSAGRVELGLVPLGAAGIAVSSMCLFVPVDSYAWAAVWLFAMGASAGLFDIPLTAYMQHRSPRESRGAVLAASNFVTFSGMLFASGLFLLLGGPLHLGARGIFLLSGVATLGVFLYSVWLLPGATLRFAVWLASHTVYRLRVYGRENLPEMGGALLTANHVTWLDGVFLLLSSSRPVRMLAYADYVERWWIRWLARIMGVIPIKPGGRSMVESLRACREALKNGELVCIFPEGALTRSGQLESFKPGLLAILEGTDVPVVPVYLNGLWGSIFSFQGGRFFWKRPQRWPFPVSIHFGPRIDRPSDVNEVRQAVEQLGVEAVEKERKSVLSSAFLRMCRRNMFRPKVADSTGTELTGASLLMRSLIVRRVLARTLASDEKFVGLLLPPSAGAVLANAALSIDRRVAVNLNYTLSSDMLDSCISQCGIRHVLTSRRAMEKFHVHLNVELLYLEDLIPQVTVADKLVAGLATWAMPAFLLERLLGFHRQSGKDLLTVIFTSGSTGEPKGVMLSHDNVASNIEAIHQVMQLNRNDVLAGILPFFHSTGSTVTLWTVLALDPKGVYHFNPLDAHQVGKLCGKHRATFFVATPTFLRSYLRRCQREDFASLEVVITGAEKLPVDLASAFEEKFGVRPLEGYGATELSPLVSVNVPACRMMGSNEGMREGTVGRPVPGVKVKVVDPETGKTLPPGESGMLWATGSNVMLGYLNRPDLTDQVMRDGWYVTGDIAELDADGFIRITGRVSRFSKIGGEMVPHILVEETLQRVLAADENELKAAVSAVPDVKRGERLVVFHTSIDKTPEQVCKDLAEAGLPHLWIPSPDSFCEVDEMPVLGTGKLDLKALQQLALQKFGEPAATS